MEKMKRQILKLYNFGEWTIIKDDSVEKDPYRIYFKHNENGKTTKKQMYRCARLVECLWYLYNTISKQEWN